MGLMEKMKFASDLEAMSVGQKFLASMQVTLFGMAIVFVALFLLFSIIKFLEIALSRSKNKGKSFDSDQEISMVEKEPDLAPEDDGQLVAVITAAIASCLHTSTHNIIVRNIVRVPNERPSWGKLGLIQQINDRGQ